MENAARASLALVATFALSPAVAQELAVPPVVVSGTVVTMHGEPVAEATVEVRDESNPDKLVCTVRTDAAGAFASKRLPGGRAYVVRAQHGGCSVAESLAACPPFPLRLVVFDGITLRGTLRDPDGTPHAGVEVLAVPWLEGAGEVFATTGSDGSFVLRNLPRGRTRLLAVVPGQGLWWCEHRATGDATVELTPHASPTRSVRFQVDGLPEGAAATTRLELHPLTFRGAPRAWRSVAIAADGSATVADLPNWKFRVRPRRTGLAFQPPHATLGNEGGLGFLTVARTSAAPIEFRLVDGNPLPGERLIATNGLGSHAATWAADDTVRITVAGAGDLHLLSSDPGRAVLAAHVRRTDDASWRGAATMPTTTLRGCSVAMPPANGWIELLLGPAAHVSGRVVDTTGTPVAGAVVHLFDPGSSPKHDGLPWTTTDGDGRYLLGPVPPVAHPVQLFAEHMATAAWSIVFPLDGKAPTKVPDIRMSAAARIDGVVRDPQQRPTPGVRVRAIPWYLDGGQVAPGPTLEVVTDGNGRYAFSLVASNAVLLQTLAMENAVTTRACAPFATPPGSTTTSDLVVTP